MPRSDIQQLTDIPNVGKAIARDLNVLGITQAHQLPGKDPYQLYEQLCTITGTRHDPCVCDVFIAAIRFMEGGPARKWWEFTAERKARLGKGS